VAALPPRRAAASRSLLRSRRAGFTSESISPGPARSSAPGGPYATLNLGLTGADGEPRDDPEHVQANRRLLAGQLGLPWERIVRGRQVHGITVHRVDEVPRAALADQGRRPGDGHATALRGVGALVLVADCLPIALAAPGAAAMLHAGWRGLAGGILARGVERLREVASEADPSGDPGAAGYGPATGLVAAIGPGIGGCCYEVGDEVRAAFGALGEDAGRDGRLDLKLIARRQLAELGVAQVHDVGLCTACSDPGLFFSHRRDLGVTGRQCGIVWRT